MNGTNVRIVTDSSCDLPQSVVDELGITIVPLTIRIAGEEFIDRVELDTATFWAKCAASPTLPETAAPSPGQFEAEYRRLAGDGASCIVVICLSSALSATLQSAELAARAVAGDIEVRVIDSRTVSMALGLIVAEAGRRALAGASLGDIATTVADLVERTKLWGALDTLENLKKGGRIGGAKAMLATVLSIKPIVEVRDGRVEEGGKQRTRSKALAFLVDKMASYGPLDSLAVLHAECADVEQFVAMLGPHYQGEIIVGDIGPVVGSHAGRGTIGVAFTVK